jgi:hypothetical protein
MRSKLRHSLYGLTVFIITLILSGCGDDAPINPVEDKPLLTGPAAIDLGTLYAGECSDTIITYDNTASFAVTITAVKIEGTDVMWVGATLPVTVAAGKSLDLSFRACPASTGTLNRKVLIRSSTDSISITLLGNVIPVKLTSIGAFYAHPDLTIPISLKVRDSIVIKDQVYGEFRTGDAPIGERTFIFQNKSGVELASSEKVVVDSANSLVAIYTGLGIEDEVIMVNTPHGSALAPNFAGLRVINASKNAPKVKVMLDAAQGPTLTPTAIEFGTSNGNYAPISINTGALVLVNDDGIELLTLMLNGGGELQTGKLYTLIVYGNAKPDAAAHRLTVSLVQDPGQ